MRVGEKNPVALGRALSDARNRQSFRLLLPVRPGQLTAEVDKNSGVAAGDLCDTAADLMGSAPYPDIHS